MTTIQNRIYQQNIQGLDEARRFSPGLHSSNRGWTNVNTHNWKLKNRGAEPRGHGNWIFTRKNLNQKHDPRKDKEGKDYIEISGPYREAAAKAQKWADSTDGPVTIALVAESVESINEYGGPNSNEDDGDPANWDISPGGWYYPSGMPGVGGRYWQVNPYSYEGEDYGGGDHGQPPSNFPGPAWQGRKGEKYQRWDQYVDPSRIPTVEPAPGDEIPPMFPNSPLLPKPSIPNLFK